VGWSSHQEGKREQAQNFDAAFYDSSPLPRLFEKIEEIKHAS
jgi:hypothetical protein